MAQKQGGSKKSKKDKTSRKHYHSQNHRMENKVRHILANFGDNKDSDQAKKVVADYRKKFAARA